MGLTGETGVDALIPVIVLQAVLSTAGVLLVWAIGRRSGGRGVGLVAAGLAAGYAPFLYQASIAMPTSLILFVHLLALWLLVRATQAERDEPEGARLSVWLLVGGSLALAAAAHGTGLALAAAVLAWLSVAGSAKGLRRRLVVVALVLAGLLPPILAITARNYWVSGDFVLLTSNAGKNFYIGHNPVADGTFGPHWFPVWGSGLGTYIQGEQRSPEDPAPSEVSRWLARKAWRYIGDHPDKAAALAWRKLRLLFNGYEASQDDNPYFARRFSRTLQLPLVGFVLVGSLGLAGLVPALLERRRYAPLLICLAAEAAAFSMMFVLARYRAFIAAILMVLASRFLFWAWESFRSRSWKRLAVGALALVAAWGFVTWDVPGFHRERGFGQQHLAVARSYLEEGELAEADRHARAALAASFAPYRDIATKKAMAEELRGRIALARHDWEAAELHFSSALERLSGRPRMRPGAARLAERLRQLRRAASSRAAH
jgi:4-amino-4-deoxy-L-arabinose transferase-like glycosyltransferase